MANTGFYFRSGVPDALIRAAQKMSAALKSGMEAKALRMTLELCMAETIARASSVYGLDPQSWSATAYGGDLTTFGTYPFALPDLSGLFRMGLLGRFTPEELAQQKLLARYLIHKGCDADRKSSVGISYNEVMSHAEALMEMPIACSHGRGGAGDVISSRKNRAGN